MKLKVRKKDILIFLSIFLIVIGDSRYLININKASFFQYIGYLLLMIEVFISFHKSNIQKGKRKDLTFFIVVGIFLYTGILLQQLPIATIMRLEFTMICIAAITTLSSSVLNDEKSIKSSRNGLILGVIVSLVLAIIGGNSLTNIVHEGTIQTGFNGGLEHKNYFAGAMLCILISEDSLEKLSKNKSKYNSSLYLKILVIFLIIISASRGGYILLFSYIILNNYSLLLKISKRERIIFIPLLIVLITLLGGYTYKRFALSSSTYMYRIRGIFNYINFFKNDTFHMIFGNSELAYSNSTNEDFGWNIRALVGWDGTLEFSYLEILIKNGILGIIGYVLIFIRFEYLRRRIKSNIRKQICFAVFITLLISSLVETYIVNVHLIYGIFSYLLIMGMNNHIRKDA